MYLPSKFTKSKFGILLLILVVLIVYFFVHSFFKRVAIYFYGNFLFSNSRLKQEIVRIKADNLRLSLEKKYYQDIKKENEKLRRILGLKEEYRIDILPLRVISAVPTRFKRTIFVKGGKDHKLKENTPVLDEEGFLIGKISKVYNNFSEITLINDPDFFITVKIGNNLGLLRGTLYGMLKVYYIEKDVEIDDNEEVLALLYSWGRNFPIGKVVKIKKLSNSFFMDITVKPYSKLYPSLIVFAVK